MTEDQVLAALYAVANDGECEVLDDFILRAELRWRCSSCGWHNVPPGNRCDGCGKQYILTDDAEVVNR